MNKFSIKDIENLTGIKAHTLRIWEKRYGILAPKRTTTNIRYYDAADLKLALRVALLNNYGYKISRIHKMTDAEMSSLLGKISDEDFKLQDQTNQLLEATIAMDIEGFEGLLNAYIKRHGIERCVEELIFLFLEKVGKMWVSDRLYPAQEHLASNVIWRKLVLAIEQTAQSVKNNTSSVMLFLPEGEQHDIGLLYVCYLMQQQNVRPIFLGRDTPLGELQVVYQNKKPDYLYTHLTSTTRSFDIGTYTKKLSTSFPDAKIFISGRLFKRKPVSLPANMQVFSELSEVKDLIKTL